MLVTTILPVESSHFHVTVKGRVNGGSTVVAEAGEVTGWVEELSINSEGKLYAKGFACAKNHNKPIMVKIVAQKGSDPMQILGKNPTNRAVDKFQTCGNGGDGLHGFVWTSSRPAADFKGSRISVIGVHPSGRGALDREIPGKAITIE